MKKVRESTREELKKPFGKLVSSEEAVIEARKAKDDGRLLISVGDCCAHVFISNGIHPDLLIYDEICKRNPTDANIRESIASFQSSLERAKNPAGCITEELEQKLDAALKSGNGKIFVEGEEDLAVLPAIIRAPIGSLIAYGQPNEGMVLVEVTKEAKEKARKIYDELEKSDQ